MLRTHHRARSVFVIPRHGSRTIGFKTLTADPWKHGAGSFWCRRPGTGMQDTCGPTSQRSPAWILCLWIAGEYIRCLSMMVCGMLSNHFWECVLVHASLYEAFIHNHNCFRYLTLSQQSTRLGIRNGISDAVTRRCATQLGNPREYQR